MDSDGRYVIIKVKMKAGKYVLANVYALNTYGPNVFTIFFTEVDKLNTDLKIIAGDFKLVLDLSSKVD